VYVLVIQNAVSLNGSVSINVLLNEKEQVLKVFMSRKAY
jgi:hypothetical protein